MAKMTDLLYNIPKIVPQERPLSSVAAADGLYEKFYSPIEEYDPLSEIQTDKPLLTDMETACDYLVSCFSFGRLAILSDYMKDLFFFRLVDVCGKESTQGSTGTSIVNIYQDILDEVEGRWSDYTFKAIDPYMTFAMIKDM